MSQLLSGSCRTLSLEDVAVSVGGVIHLAPAANARGSRDKGSGCCLTLGRGIAGRLRESEH